MNSTRVPWGALAALAVVVGAAHLWLLGAVPQAMQVAGSRSPRTLVTRTIEPPVPALLPAAAPAPVPRMTPVAVSKPVSPPAPKIARASLVPAVGAADAPAPAPASAPAPAALPAVASDASVHAAAFALAPSARLHYKVTAQARGMTLEGDGELQWRHDADSYEAQLQVSAPFLPKRIQRSNGRVTAQGLEPLRFSDKARNEEAAHFQREEGKVTFSSNKPDAPLAAGAQDRLSVMLQLGAMIAGEPGKFRPGTSIAIQTASTREAEPWVFIVEGSEQLQLPGGHVPTLKLTRAPRKEFDQKVELWLAPGMAYVPVRLRLTQPNGDWVDQQWSSTDRG